MKDRPIDDARLAALLDGRVDDAEREDLLARLSEADEDYLVFADAAAILREREGVAEVPAPETDEDDPPAPERIAVPDIAPAPVVEHPVETEKPAAAESDVIPLRPRRRFPLAAWAALAAVLAGVALIPVLRARAGDPYDPARLASAVEGSAATSGAEWTSMEVFSRTRGVGPVVTDEGRAVRLGALSVDLELAVGSRDTMTAYLARSVRALVGDVSGAVSVENLYIDIENQSGAPAEQLRPLVKEGREQLAGLGTHENFQAGAWTEAARLASKARDTSFFRTRASLKQLETLSSLAPRDIAAIRAALPADGAPDWAVLDEHLAALLRSLGR